jgi:hypothetical protein
MAALHKRFETREEINAAISFLVSQGVALDEIDVELTKIGAVDLDLCVLCLEEMSERLRDHKKVA